MFRARWVLPIAQPPIEDGVVEILDGRIVSVGPGTRDGGEPWPLNDGPWTDLGDVALLPGLVNAHTHLELSWMAGLVPPKPAMDEWIRTLMSTRRAGPAGGESEISTAAFEAARSMVETGTVLVGDISNTLITPEILDAAGLGGVVFHELIGFGVTDAEPIVSAAWERATRAEKKRDRDSFPRNESRSRFPRFSVVAHAPYSVSPALIAEIARQRGGAPLAIHLGESVEEMEFILTGQGPIRAMLERLGVWDGSWAIPGCDPAEYVDRLGYLQPGTLVVHAVKFGPDAIARLRERGAVVVSCPRSNRWVGSGSPPLAALYRAGVPVAFGTDSLASAPSLNLFDELAEARRIAPDVPASLLIDSATRQGAEALGLGADYGTIEAGKRAALIAVRLRGPAVRLRGPAGRFGATDVRTSGETDVRTPGDVSVEEYLVGGNVRAPQDVRLIRSR